MINLIRSEFYKIFHKKSTLIVLIVILAMVILTNYLYSLDMNYGFFGDTTYLEEYLEEIPKENKEERISIQADIEVNKIIGEYGFNSWQGDYAYLEFYEVALAYYRALEYGDDATDAKARLDELKQYFKNDDWQYSIRKDIEDAKSLLGSGDEMSDKVNLKKIELLEYRLENDIAPTLYVDGISDAITENMDLYQEVLLYESLDNELEKEKYEESVKTYYENEYIIENKVDINNASSVYEVLKNIFLEFEFLMLVFLFMIAGGMISEEFNKGTVKNLLTLPYSRTKILAAKYITVLLLIPFIFVVVLILELIFGSLILGAGSLSYPVINYVVSEGSLELMNIFQYVGLLFVAYLPKLILLVTLAFALSIIILNTAFAITMTFAGYIAADIINMMAVNFDIKILKYFVTSSWDFSPLILGGSMPFNLSLTESLITCIIYLGIMLAVTFMVFKNRNVKNI